MNLPVIMMLLGTAVVALIAFELLKLVRELVSKAALSEVKERIRSAPRHWHPRTPGDCPLCTHPFAAHTADLVEVTPWVHAQESAWRTQTHQI